TTTQGWPLSASTEPVNTSGGSDFKCAPTRFVAQNYFAFDIGISKRGDAYVRTLLMHGARAVICRSRQTAWIQQLLARRRFSVVVAALANKLARTVWALLTRGKAFDQAQWEVAGA